MIPSTQIQLLTPSHSGGESKITKPPSQSSLPHSCSISPYSKFKKSNESLSRTNSSCYSHHNNANTICHLSSTLLFVFADDVATNSPSTPSQVMCIQIDSYGASRNTDIDPGQDIKNGQGEEAPPVTIIDVIYDISDDFPVKEQDENYINRIMFDDDSLSTSSSSSSIDSSTVMSISVCNSSRGILSSAEHCCTHLENECNKRWKLLRKIIRTVQGNSNSYYVKYLMEQENVVQNGLMQNVLSNTDDNHANTKELLCRNNKCHSFCPLTSTGENLRRKLMFEKYHTIPAWTAFMTYLVMHCSVFEVVHIVHVQCTEKLKGSSLYINIGTIFLVCLIYRYSGVLWEWVDDGLYKSIKFDFHNKYHLGHWDAKIMKWMRRHQELRGSLNLLGLYIGWVCVGAIISEVYMPAFCDRRDSIAKKLPSRQFDVKGLPPTWIRKLLSRADLSWAGHNSFVEEDADSAFRWVGSVSLCDEDVVCCNGLHAFWANINIEDETYFRSQVAESSFIDMMGDERAAAASMQCSLGFYISHGFVASLLLRKLRIEYWD